MSSAKMLAFMKISTRYSNIYVAFKASSKMYAIQCLKALQLIIRLFDHHHPQTQPHKLNKGYQK